MTELATVPGVALPSGRWGAVPMVRRHGRCRLVEIVICLRWSCRRSVRSRRASDLWEPVRLIDADGEPVVAVTAFLQELQASGRSAATQRSYAMDLLRWFRFGWAIDVAWDQATRVEARDFCRWLALRDKPSRAVGRRRRAGRGQRRTR